MDFAHLVSAALTDIGHKRTVNGDALLCVPEAGVFCVADGMGMSPQGGKVASQAVVDALRECFAPSPASTATDHASRERMVRDALNRASLWIHKYSEEQEAGDNGTTAVVLMFDAESSDRAFIYHAGDSRAYRFRDHTIERLTRDHSVASDAGMENEEALPQMFRGLITRAVGLQPSVELERTIVDVRPDDLFLLCSDGLTKMLPDGSIAKLIDQHRNNDIEGLACALVAEANRAGGKDNISVILVFVGHSSTP